MNVFVFVFMYVCMSLCMREDFFSLKNTDENTRGQTHGGCSRIAPNFHMEAL